MNGLVGFVLCVITIPIAICVLKVCADAGYRMEANDDQALRRYLREEREGFKDESKD